MNEEEILKLVADAKQMSVNIRDRMERIEGLLGTPKEKVITKTDYLHPKPKGKRHKIANNPCKRCGGLISWDGYDKETRPYPLHVDEEGYEVEGCYNGS